MVKKKVLFSGMQVLLSAAVVLGCQRPVAASSNFFEKILTLQAEEDNKENGEAEEMLSGKRLLEKQYFDASGVLSGREICEYDDNNQVIVRCLYYDENELAGRYVYERDANGRITSAGFINYREDGSVRSSSTSDYEWSEDGSTLRIPWYYSGGESEGSLAGYDVTVYDGDGNVLENRSEDVNGIVQGKTVYIYE